MQSATWHASTVRCIIRADTKHDGMSYTVMNLTPGARDESRDWFAWKNTTTHNCPLS